MRGFRVGMAYQIQVNCVIYNYLKINRYYMKGHHLSSKRQSNCAWRFREQYSMVSLVKGSQTTTNSNPPNTNLNSISQGSLQNTVDQPHLHQPKLLTHNKENHERQDHSKSAKKKKIYPLVKKKDPKHHHDHDDPYKMKNPHKKKKLKNDKLKKPQNQEPFCITISNTKQTQSIIWYEEAKAENSDQLHCSQNIVESRYVFPRIYPTKLKHKTCKEELLQFQIEMKKCQIQFQAQTLYQIHLRQKKYGHKGSHSNYLAKKQIHISWFQRSIVLHWMIEVMVGFGNKRDTFAIAANLLDRYLASTRNIPLHRLQLIAGVCMLIANKIQDRIFDVEDISEAMGSNYSLDEILAYELKVIAKLQWKLNPPTAAMWANRLSAQWDAYLKQNPPFNDGCPPQLILLALSDIKFRTEDMNGYNNYRQLMEYLDLTVLDIHTLQYHSRELAASFIYLILNLRLMLYTKEQMVNIFPFSSQYILNPNPLNLYFNNFLLETFNLFLQDLLPTIQYCSTFVGIPVSLELPPAVQSCKQQMSYSQFCSFQTRNQYNLIFLQKRNRDYD